MSKLIELEISSKVCRSESLVDSLRNSTKHSVRKSPSNVFGVAFVCMELILFAVINASHTFYTGTTSVPIDKNNPTSRKRKTSALNTTSNPEDKRKIIGDTFMKVK